MAGEISLDARLQTGVPGLDRVLGGGLPPGGVYVVEGPPGAGKTILGNQLCHQHAARGQQALYLTLLAESHSRMLSHLRGLSFYHPEVVGSSVHYVSGFKLLESEGLGSLSRMVREEVSARKATLLLVDGAGSALDAAASEREYKKFLHELQAIASMTQCTTVLLVSTERTRATLPEHTMVDGIVELSDELTHPRALRYLQVHKLRGADPVRGRHTLSISDDGICVRVRIEADLLRLPEEADLVTGPERAAFGVPGLDEMLEGGVPVRSVTMVMGPSGSGKTLLGLQFLAAGAHEGERGVYFGFYERPKTLLAKSRRLGLGLSELHERGQLRLLWEPFGERSIDRLGERLLSVVREYRPARLCLDGLHGFEQGEDAPERLTSVFSAIAEELEAQGVTSLYTMEAHDLVGPVVQAPIRGVSAITHNILLLRYVDLSASVRRAISVLKLRDSAHDSRIRELVVADSGLRVVDGFGRMEGVLSGSVRRSEVAANAPTEVNVTPPVGAPRSPAEPRAKTRATILIVDDEFGLADVLAELLGEQGYETTIAINGELGLSALAERRPDLVLLDVMMPVVSGLEMLQRMKADPKYAAIPVVLMTAIPRAASAEPATLAEAVLHKPFSPEKLFEVVSQILSRRAPEKP